MLKLWSKFAQVATCTISGLVRELYILFLYFVSHFLSSLYVAAISRLEKYPWMGCC